MRTRGSLKPSADQRGQYEHRKGDLPNPPKLGTLAGSTSVISWRNLLVVTRAYRRKETDEDDSVERCVCGCRKNHWAGRCCRDFVLTAFACSSLFQRILLQLRFGMYSIKYYKPIGYCRISQVSWNTLQTRMKLLKQKALQEGLAHSTVFAWCASRRRLRIVTNLYSWQQQLLSCQHRQNKTCIHVQRIL